MKYQLKHYLRVIFFLLLLIVFIPGLAAAQGSDPSDDEINAIAKQLYCPVCENIPLDTCGTTACEQWRGIIRDKLREGWSDEQIKGYFVEQYGDRVLAEPPRSGFNWFVYVVPVIIFAGGGILLVLGFQKWRTTEPEKRSRELKKQTRKSKKPIDEYINQVEEELRKRSRE